MLLARTPRLAVVGNVAVGVDNVDLAACAARGVIVTASTAVLAAGKVINNQHNQILNVAVQWGTVGVAVLFAMWFYFALKILLLI